MGERSVHVGGNVTGSSVVTGDNNSVFTRYEAVQLPPPESVDIKAELAALREQLAALQGPDHVKALRAMDDAEDEAKKPSPDKGEIGGALERALTYAKKADNFSSRVEKIAPRLEAACSWLGENWHNLLAVAGITLAKSQLS